MKSFEEQADGLCDVLEQTIHARVLKELDVPLHTIIHCAVRDAVTTASHAGRPIQGGRCREIWDTLGALTQLTGEVPTLKDAKALAHKKNWNENTARIQYYRWRKENEASHQA